MFLPLMKSLFLISLLILLGACSESSQRQLVANAPMISVSLTQFDGSKLVLDRTPQRLISIAPNITEILYALGAGHQLVACSEACDYPDETALLEQVALHPSVDIGQLSQMEADLILSTNEVFGVAEQKVASQLGIPIWIQQYDSLSHIYDRIMEIGEVVGKKHHAQALADSLRMVDQRIAKATEPEIKYKTAVIVNIQPLQVVGGVGILQEMIQKAGGENAFGNQQEAFASITGLQLLQAQPEYIILPFGSDQAYADLIALYPMLTNTPADLHKQVFIVEPDLFFRPGPRVLEGLAELAHILHSHINPIQFFGEKPGGDRVE